MRLNMHLSINRSGPPCPAFYILVFMLVCIMCAAISVPSAAAQTISNTTEQTCHIRGKVIDSYGTSVPGAEVRLMTPDGRWCETPDNPMITGMQDPAGAGAFEFTAGTNTCYVLNALKDNHNGSVRLCTREGDNYVEITIPGYIYVQPVQNAASSGASISRAVVEPPEQPKTMAESDGPIVERVTVDLWRLGFAAFIVLTGLLLSVTVLRWR